MDEYLKNEEAKLWNEIFNKLEGQSKAFFSFQEEGGSGILKIDNGKKSIVFFVDAIKRYENLLKQKDFREIEEN